jgi:hypothetical protein
MNIGLKNDEIELRESNNSSRSSGTRESLSNFQPDG